MSKEAMLDTRESAMNHAMVITGVNLENDTPTKWKIENSWGNKKANKGYHVATDTWFNRRGISADETAVRADHRAQPEK